MPRSTRSQLAPANCSLLKPASLASSTVKIPDLSSRGMDGCRPTAPKVCRLRVAMQPRLQRPRPDSAPKPWNSVFRKRRNARDVAPDAPAWWATRDSNPDGLPHTPLKRARLPVPPAARLQPDDFTRRCRHMPWPSPDRTSPSMTQKVPSRPCDKTDESAPP